MQITKGLSLDIAKEVAEALSAGDAVVALESTIVTHGMPYPQNVETARAVEQRIRAEGAVPATIAVLRGRIKVGLTDEELRGVDERLTPAVRDVLTIDGAVASRATRGGTAGVRVAEQRDRAANAARDHYTWATTPVRA